MRLRIALTTASALTLLPASASAQVTVAAAPNTTGAASHLKVAVDGSSPAFANRLPKGLVLSLDRGFAVDLAGAAVCSDSSGEGGGCPDDSQVASGTAVIQPSFAGAPGSDVTATIAVFRAQTPPPGAIGALLAVVEAQGQRGSSRGVVNRIADGPFGYEVRFEELAAPRTPAGVTLAFKRLDLDIGSTRRESVTTSRRIRCKASSTSRACKKRPGCRRGRRCPRYRTVRKTSSVRHDLLRNPAVCAGAWASRAVAMFEDGSAATADAPISCAG